MSKFIMINNGSIINTQCIEEIRLIESEDSWSMKFALKGEDEPVIYRNFDNKKSYQNSLQRLIQQLDILIL